MTHLVGIRIFNWARFRGEHELELGPGIYAVTARDERDPRLSNWRGKSSFIAAVRWALYGSRVMEAETLDDLVSRGEDECSVELEFDDGTFVSRKRVRGKDKRDLFLSRGGSEAAADGAQEMIERMLVGASEAELLTTAFAEQGELDRLAIAKGDKSTEAFEEWLALERLERASDQAFRTWKDSRESLEGASRALESYEREAARVEELERDLERLKAEERERLELARSYLESVRSFNDRAALRELMAEELRILEILEQNKEAFGRENATIGQEMAVARKRDVDASVRLRDAKKAFDDARLLRRGEFSGECPVSKGFDCPARERINEIGRTSSTQFEEADRLYKIAAKESNEVKRALDEIYSEEKRESDRKATVAASERRLAVVREKIAGMGGVEPWRNEDEPPQTFVSSTNPELALVEKALGDARSAREALEGARKAVENATRELRIARTVADVLGPSGARRKAVEGAVRDVSHEANRVLEESGVELSIEAVWDRATAKLAESCVECGAGFSKSQAIKRCASCGAERGPHLVRSFRWRLSDRSGAAKDLAGLALRCGAFRLLRTLRGRSFSIGAFDEPLARLDEAHREAVARHIRSMLGATFDQVFVIDHRSGFTDSFGKRIIVTGSGKWSKVEVEG